LGQLLAGCQQGLASGIAARDLAKQMLQRVGTSQPLQITHQGQAAIGLTTPAQPLALRQTNPQAHSLVVVCETLQFTGRQGSQPKIPQGLGQNADIAQDGWQDGEMGHGPSSGFCDPSDVAGAVQWPLSPAVARGDRRILRLGVMASGSGSNFEALVQACRSGRLPAETGLLVVNNPGCGAQQRAERLGIPWLLHDHRDHCSRESLDQALAASFQAAEVDLVVMAGWMRIVTQTLIEAFPERLINIHPSLLPSFRGARAIEQALAAGVRISGCTAHLVSLEVDTGPILVQAAVPVHERDDPASLATRIHVQEHRILPLAVQLAAERLGLWAPQG
jgi:phosphoribosylglycinamide formyltransferase 1